MRRFGFALTALLAAGGPTLAQSPAGLPPAAGQPPAATQPLPAAQPTNGGPGKDLLDTYLLSWEQEMQKIQTLAAQLELTQYDKAFDRHRKSIGKARYMKAGAGANTLNLALLELEKPGGKSEPERKFVCTGTFIYDMLYEQKEVRAYEIPKPKPGQVAEDNFLSFMFGMKAEEARRRYEMVIPKEKATDENWVYVEITPRFPADRSDFQRARLVLSRKTFLPRQLWFEQPNGNTILWDIPASQVGVKLDRREFDAPATPAGWKFLQEPRPGQTGTGAGAGAGAGAENTTPEKPALPRVARPSGQ